MALTALAFVLSACSAPTATPAATTVPTVVIPEPTAVPVEPTAVPTQAPQELTGELTIDVNGVAQSISAETIAAVAESSDKPYWMVLPEHTVSTLAGYPISEHLLKPQIFVYPAADLAATNEGAGKIAADLDALLKSHQPGKYMPFMPLFNAQQVLHAQVKYLDFKNGKGVRFVTQFDQAPLPVNNNELFYTFQGLTSDGKYYVAATLPLNLAGLPADEKFTGDSAEFMSGFAKYLEDTAATLDAAAASAFTPDLSALDAMMQSIEIN
jgi:hypothetical protein